MQHSRIPKLEGTSFKNMRQWFKSLAAADLLFHPEDRPEDIIRIATGEQLFSTREAEELQIILGRLFSCFGDEVTEVAYSVFIEQTGFGLDACNQAL